MRESEDEPQTRDAGVEREPVARNQDARPSRSRMTGLRDRVGTMAPMHGSDEALGIASRHGGTAERRHGTACGSVALTCPTGPARYRILGLRDRLGHASWFRTTGSGSAPSSPVCGSSSLPRNRSADWVYFYKLITARYINAQYEKIKYIFKFLSYKEYLLWGCLDPEV
uniref:Uncharacterized protein n=1 Tax=Oryza glumipatula TaxID=40148 RepID=A0A0E0BD34_9ORYZ